MIKRLTRFKPHQHLTNESANSNFYLMPQFKTSGKGFNRGIGLEPGSHHNSPLPLLTFQQLWKILKEKRSKKEKGDNNITS